MDDALNTQQDIMTVPRCAKRQQLEMEQSINLVLKCLKKAYDEFGGELSIPKTTTGTDLLYLNTAVCEATIIRKTNSFAMFALGKSSPVATDVLESMALQQFSLHTAHPIKLCPVVSIVAMVLTTSTINIHH